jgi:hypothetical protein
VSIPSKKTEIEHEIDTLRQEMGKCSILKCGGQVFSEPEAKSLKYMGTTDGVPVKPVHILG